MKTSNSHQIRGVALGWNVAILFIAGTILLGGLVQGYNPLAQTVSEIGRAGSPLQLPWQIFCVVVGVLLAIFSGLLIGFARKNSMSGVPGILLLSYAICQIGLGFFPTPHALHNVFGLLMIVGYSAPLSFALLWKGRTSAAFTRISLTCFALVVTGIFLNLTPAFAPDLYPLEYYGAVQRFLLFTFYLYIGFISIYLSVKPIRYALSKVQA
ncbi:DUF998 domain-containing protein [Robertkochia sediminum]|uniref:DUF998 domain-containing protein n=1 Tax=Robertkochia sediminum TaxID=2785326 RepID=UPI0019317733|nr:DUF998 domain-containing protein [Robertkochia sediminum]MBL7472930.1 DUF998 domain-containing protein [Robertkochia sediminum]